MGSCTSYNKGQFARLVGASIYIYTYSGDTRAIKRSHNPVC